MKRSDCISFTRYSRETTANSNCWICNVQFTGRADTRETRWDTIAHVFSMSVKRIITKQDSIKLTRRQEASTMEKFNRICRRPHFTELMYSTTLQTSCDVCYCVILQEISTFEFYVPHWTSIQTILLYLSIQTFLHKENLLTLTWSYTLFIWWVQAIF